MQLQPFLILALYESGQTALRPGRSTNVVKVPNIHLIRSQVDLRDGPDLLENKSISALLVQPKVLNQQRSSAAKQLHGVIQYLIQQAARSVMNNRLSLMFLLYVSTSTGSSLRRYIQRHTNTSKLCQRCACLELLHTYVLGQNLLYLYVSVYTSLMMTLQRSKHVGGT